MFIEPNSQDAVNCPDQCHSVAYSSQASTCWWSDQCEWSTFRCRPQTLLIIQSSSCTTSSSKRIIKLDHSSWSSGNILMYVFFQSMDHCCCYIQDTFKSWDQTSWNRTVLGSPKGSSDPRFVSAVAIFSHSHRKMNCAERTVRNKIGKMTYLHIYFDSYGVTKFTKSQRFGWQVRSYIGIGKDFWTQMRIQGWKLLKGV